MIAKKPAWIVCSIVSLVGGLPSLACQVEPESTQLASVARTSPEVSIRRTLLSLLHAPEIQRELSLSEKQCVDLDRLFDEIDGPWWRARNLSAEEQERVVQGLETRVWEFVREHWSADAVSRLQQLEMQSQGVRMLHRPDVIQLLSLTRQQQNKLVSLAETTDRIEAEGHAAMRRGESTEALAQRLEKVKQDEQRQGFELLTPQQGEALERLVGKPFDFSSLHRIYPKAPPLVVTDGWAGDPPASIDAWKGKVVVVHFYAFQCINCQRNLPIYNEWVQRFAGRDVVVVGIQTPETPAERDIQQITAAARENRQQYPVLVDLQNKNWDAWGNTMWPTVYVIDRQGYIRLWWQGELKWQGAKGDQVVIDAIERLLDEDE
ncbi:MAG TPA: redoxin domain-containing protein [Pirellulaceae bacterium]|nr:redoxin domain-containing protein [Pirellulaceae bacterium]